VHFRRSLTLVFLLALGSCLGRDLVEPGDHRETTLLVRADVAAVAVASLVVEVTAPDITTPLAFNIPITNGVAAGTITIPAGSSRTITMHAFDAGGVETHRGSVTVTIQPGTNPLISIVLTPLAGDVPINATLGSFTVRVAPAADTLVVNGTVALAATILDANGSPVAQPVVWATLDPGVATVASTGDRTAQVTAVAPGTTTVVASFGGSGGPAALVVSATPTLQLIATGLSFPLYLTQPPGDASRLFVVEQTGRIRVIRNDTLLSTPFLDLTSIISFSGEQGLLSMAFHPDYVRNGQFFVYYVDRNYTIQVSRYTVSSNPEVADPTSAQTVLSVIHPPNTNHNGGLVTFGPDGYLYIGVGDGGTGGVNGQDSTTLLGKILRIDVTAASPYVVPAGNPFVGRPPAAPEIWAYGFRNPWRFSFDRSSGDLYIADVGEDAYEEVDVQASTSGGGQNYGWNVMEGAHCFNPPTGCNTAGLTLPTFEYSHGVSDANGCAIMGGYVYRGKRLPILEGRYFWADLCRGWVKSFRVENGAAVDLTDYTPQFGLLSSPSSFGEDGLGELYITTQGDGSVYRIAPALPSATAPLTIRSGR
jgi:glucose/arabinose dehydrogenase